MTDITIAGRRIGLNHPTYVIAEVSANHGQKYDQAVEIIEAAQRAGADAVKLQTYTADTLTIDSDAPSFRIGGGTIWEGRRLHELYQEAHMPWEWQPRLQAVAAKLGLPLFSTPFDATAVDFLEGMQVPAYKIASLELVDLPLIERVARLGKPIIMSTGTATLGEIDQAVRQARAAGAQDIALLKCTSAYPSPPEQMNLRTIPHLASAFGVVSGLSDHTMGSAVPVAAVALGARIIEKHITLSRDIPGPDSSFSLEPAEFQRMVEDIRTAEKALGDIRYEATENEKPIRGYQRSLFIVADVKAGEPLTESNVRSIRPGDGLPPKHLRDVLGRRAIRDIARGTPLDWSLLG